jgi:hypothetical protein
VRGASALGDLLKDVPAAADLEVFVVWLPVVPSDLGPPSREKLALLPGARVRQYWDPGQALSRRIVDSLLANPQLGRSTFQSAVDVPPVSRETVVWDTVALFNPGAEWTQAFPEPAWWFAPVLDGLPELRRRLAESE